MPRNGYQGVNHPEAFKLININGVMDRDIATLLAMTASLSTRQHCFPRFEQPPPGGPGR